MGSAPAAPSSVLLWCPDLFFSSKIRGTAAAAGITLRAARAPAALVEEAARERPALVIIDLKAAGEPALLAIAALRRHPALAGLPIVAFLAHTQVELRRRAAEAGCTRVLARSELTVELPRLLTGDLAAGSS